MNIPLLADKTHAVSRAYGVLKEDDGISFRGLFIIDGKSVLRQVRFSMANITYLYSSNIFSPFESME